MAEKENDWGTTYPLVNIEKAIENGPVEIVDLLIKNGGSFHSYVNVYQAGSVDFCRSFHGFKSVLPFFRPLKSRTSNHEEVAFERHEATIFHGDFHGDSTIKTTGKW